MAGLRKLTGFDANDFGGSGGFASKYDWDEILSGEVVFLQDGKDYDRERESFKSSIRTRANARGLAVNMKNIDQGSDIAKKYKLNATGVVVQTRPGTPEEVAKWEEQAEHRKEQNKARAKAKREAAKGGGDEAAE